MVVVRRVLLGLVLLFVVCFAVGTYFIATIRPVHSGGCHGIPLTASGQPAYKCP